MRQRDRKSGAQSLAIGVALMLGAAASAQTSGSAKGSPGAEANQFIEVQLPAGSLICKHASSLSHYQQLMRDGNEKALEYLQGACWTTKEVQSAQIAPGPVGEATQVRPKLRRSWTRANWTIVTEQMIASI